MESLLGISFIRGDNRLLAMKIPAKIQMEPGIKFLTDESEEFQVGIMKRSSDMGVRPHTHIPKLRQVHSTSEVLFIRDGICEISIFDDKLRRIENLKCESGDIVILFGGSHSINFLTECFLVEVKQGPYVAYEDKIFL